MYFILTHVEIRKYLTSKVAYVYLHSSPDMPSAVFRNKNLS